MLGTRTLEQNRWESYSKAFTNETNTTSAFLSSLTDANLKEETTEESREALTDYFYAKVNHCGKMIVVLEKAKALAEEEDKKGLAKELCKYKEMKAAAISVRAVVERIPWDR